MIAGKIQNTNVSPTDSFFFDTNVWMFIFAPLANARKSKQKDYSAFLKKIMSRGATIWINSLVVAEYVNAVLRLEFKQWKRQKQYNNADFKHDFRPTSEYKSALEAVKLQVADIMSVATKRPDDFHKADIEQILSSMESMLDYGDSVLVDSCVKNKMILVTDDSDITGLNLSIPVLTA